MMSEYRGIFFNQILILNIFVYFKIQKKMLSLFQKEYKKYNKFPFPFINSKIKKNILWNVLQYEYILYAESTEKFFCIFEIFFNRSLGEYVKLKTRFKDFIFIKKNLLTLNNQCFQRKIRNFTYPSIYLLLVFIISYLF